MVRTKEVQKDSQPRALDGHSTHSRTAPINQDPLITLTLLLARERHPQFLIQTQTDRDNSNTRCSGFVNRKALGDLVSNALLDNAVLAKTAIFRLRSIGAVCDARDQVAGLVVFRASRAELDDGAAEVATDCVAGDREGFDGDVFPGWVSVAMDWLTCWCTILPVSGVDRDTFDFDQDEVVPQPGHWDGLHLGLAGRNDFDGFHCLGRRHICSGFSVWKQDKGVNDKV